MSHRSLYFSAAQSFEAARRAGGGLHGHGFHARIITAQHALEAPFPGTEADALAEGLAAAVAPLDYSLLEDRVDATDDPALADWILAALALDGTAAVELGSAPDRGAIAKTGGERLVWQRFRMESAHRLPNVPPGHKCGRMHGHGFEVTLYCALEAGREMLTTQHDIARAWQPLHETLHLACLNDLPGLENPTSEVLAQWIWQRLGEARPALAGVSVMETASAGCHFDGARWRIWKSASFDSAVRLSRAPKNDPRRLIHGHTFTTRLHLVGELDEVMGWVYDYGDVKRHFDPVFGALDHQPLYEQPELADNDPASVAAYIDSELAATLPGLSRVDVLHTPGCGALLCRQADEHGLLVP